MTEPSHPSGNSDPTPQGNSAEPPSPGSADPGSAQGSAAYPPPGSPSGAGYPPPSAGYPPPGGQYPPPGDQYPPGGQYPPSGGYPPHGGNPPPGGYPPPWGYPPPGYYGPPTPPPGYATSEEKNWALVAHFGGAAGAFISWGTFGWVAPLVALLAKGQQSPTVRAHALAALNFQLLWAILSFAAVIIGACLIWLILPGVLFLVPLIPIIFGMVGGACALDGHLYRYPMTVTWVK